MLSWRVELKELLLARDASHRLWQIAFFSALMIPATLVIDRFATEALIALIDLLFLAHCAGKKQWGWLREPMTVMLLAAWAWMVLVVTPMAHNIAASSTIALPWVRFIVFFAAMRCWVFTEERPFKIMAMWMAFIFILIVVDTMWQYTYGISLTNHRVLESGRLTGPFDNVKVGIYLSRMLLPVIGLCIFFSFPEQFSRGAILIYALLCCAVLVTIAMSGERAPFGTAIFGILTVLGVAAFREKQLRVTCLCLIAATIVLVYALIFTQPWIYSRLKYTLDLAMGFRHSSYGQLLWMAWDMGNEHLMTGVGMRNFRDIAQHYVDSSLATHHNIHPHHPYLEWFAEAGLPGLLLFLVFICFLIFRTGAVLRRATKKRALLAAFVAGTLVVLLFPLVPTQSFFTNWPAMMFWFALSLTMAALNLCDPNAPDGHRKPG